MEFTSIPLAPETNFELISNVDSNWDTYQEMKYFVRNLADEEPQGYPLLGIWGTSISRELTNRFNGITFSFSNQYTVGKNHQPGQNPSCDMGLLLCSDGLTTKPIVIFEYKCGVAPSFFVNPLDDVIELLVQCFYAVKNYSLPFVYGCLTNLEHSHIFLFESRGTSTISIQGSHYMIVHDKRSFENAIKVFVTLTQDYCQKCGLH